jgi:hypothetical protein
MDIDSNGKFSKVLRKSDDFPYIAKHLMEASKEGIPPSCFDNLIAKPADQQAFDLEFVHKAERSSKWGEAFAAILNRLKWKMQRLTYKSDLAQLEFARDLEEHFKSYAERAFGLTEKIALSHKELFDKDEPMLEEADLTSMVIVHWTGMRLLLPMVLGTVQATLSSTLSLTAATQALIELVSKCARSNDKLDEVLKGRRRDGIALFG